MVGEARRIIGSVSVAADSRADVELKAVTGEQIKVAAYGAKMAAGAAGSQVVIQIGSGVHIADESDTYPAIISCNLTSVPVLYIDDTVGIKVFGNNKATTAQTLYYGIQGVKIN